MALRIRWRWFCSTKAPSCRGARTERDTRRTHLVCGAKKHPLCGHAPQSVHMCEGHSQGIRAALGGGFRGIRGHSRAFARLGRLLAKLVRCNGLQAYRSHAYVKRTRGVGWAGRRGKEERTRKSSEQSPFIILILWGVGFWVGWGGLGCGSGSLGGLGWVGVCSRILGGSCSFNTCSCCYVACVARQALLSHVTVHSISATK